MITLPKDASDDAVLNVVRRWLNELAKEDYSAAHSLTYHPAGDHWNADLLRRVIENYGSVDSGPEEGVTFKVTPLEGEHSDDSDVAGRLEIEWFRSRGSEDNPLGTITCDLPLNGEWSDVSAVFNVLSQPDGLALQLMDVRVL